LVAMFDLWPEGAFAFRVGTRGFAEDINAIFQLAIDELHAKKVEEARQAGELASYLTITDEAWDENALPPRPWIAPPYLMRRQIALLHGPGGGGKSQLLIAWAIALALGVAFGRLKPKQRCRVLLTNFEAWWRRPWGLVRRERASLSGRQGRQDRTGTAHFSRSALLRRHSTPYRKASSRNYGQRGKARARARATATRTNG
jgi:hypothetical protein